MVTPGAAGPPQRVVLLGASNLTISLPLVVAATRALWGRQVEIMAAVGHGRSYGRPSRVLLRELPGIIECGLWQQLAAAAGPTAALVTDIGNDLLYGAEPREVTAWVGECLGRLQAAGAQVAITRLPIGNLESLSPRRYRFFRRLFFPNCRLELADVSAAARELDQRVAALAASSGAALVPQQPGWYGLDPIHIARRRRREAWSTILGTWRPELRGQWAWRTSWYDALRLHTASERERRVLGMRFEYAQPSTRWREGTSVALY